ncbi:hypothetical protein KOW79_002752 [Hemibagrus wyckioides]|uniref:Uncharacterized protein n=1 Tax=Hemibagrus wyckioides TaxID=337641 RepID=A0A9D3P434_9TELE|nr:hypothetical protein KOW79_002752 [Hemibagrus wyckioides]
MQGGVKKAGAGVAGVKKRKQQIKKEGDTEVWLRAARTGLLPVASHSQADFPVTDTTSISCCSAILKRDDPRPWHNGVQSIYALIPERGLQP